jgi:hypothetical protein
VSEGSELETGNLTVIRILLPQKVRKIVKLKYRHQYVQGSNLPPYPTTKEIHGRLN